MTLTEEAKKAARITLPSHMSQSIIDYFEHGLPPGSFLTAVLSNDLVGAFAHADHVNREHIGAYVAWLYNYPPGRPNGWGSPEAVKAWIKEAADERYRNNPEVPID